MAYVIDDFLESELGGVRELGIENIRQALNYERHGVCGIFVLLFRWKEVLSCVCSVNDIMNEAEIDRGK